MYTAKIISKKLVAGRNTLDVQVEFYNDGEHTATLTFNFPLYTTLEMIKKRIKEQIEELEKGDTLEPQVVVGDIDVADVVTGISAEDQAMADFFQAYNRRERVQQFIDWGIVPETHPKVVALNNTIQAALQSDPTIIDKL